MLHPDYERSRLREGDAIDPKLGDAVQCVACLEYWVEGELPGEEEDECPDCGNKEFSEVEKDDNYENEDDDDDDDE
ncbi:hypothetical protein LMH73_010240 [Vibrio splendidus]|nr:hypothetical protein [Vibrio splendidus]MCC4882962.1 hypothetical protein [Vibrio splendidus]